MQDLAAFEDRNYEFLRPIVTGWLAKLESALTCPARKRWKEVADECHDEQTEVLTSTGWMLFSDLTGDEPLGTVNLETDTIEFQVPTRLVRHHRAGEMIRFAGKSLDAMVTPGHRMVFFPPHSGRAALKEASSLRRSEQLKLTSANWHGTKPRLPDFVGDTDPADFAEWLGFYIAEGWCSKKSEKKARVPYRVGIAQKKTAGRRYYEQLAKRVGFPAPPYSKLMKSYTFTSKELCEYLRQFGTSCYDKRVPQWVKDSPQNVIRAFLRGYLAGDGHVRHGHAISGTASKQLADDIQELWLKIGRSASISERQPAPYAITDPGLETRTGMSGKLYLVTSWSEGKRASLKRHTGDEIKLKYHTEQYDGMVYCATVPNGTLITRRNGKPLISGNCVMFYGKSAAAMWDPLYAKKFWRGVKAPRFRININKAFEYVAVFGPNLLWDVPHRTATSKKLLEIPPELFPDQQLYQFIQQQAAQESASDKIVGHMMQQWLNYTPREMPGDGLSGHNELAVLDAMLKGAGCLIPGPYTMPGSDLQLTGCFHCPPEDLIYDPDFKTSQQCKWVARKHIQPHWQVERKFKLPKGALKGKASLESGWHYAEAMSQEGQATGERKSGKTNDLVVWYEIWSKCGVGSRMTGMPDMLKNQLEETVGDYAYLAICPDCPYPLNCPSDKIRSGASCEEVRSHFEWPIPLWTDDRWPVERLIFYQDTDSPYGLPPLAPALGELKAINAIVSWLVNRTWQSSRQMWAVMSQYHDELKKQLEDGDDMSVFGIPIGGDQDVKKMIQLVEGKDINKDPWEVLELLNSLFDKRMGMTPFVYGQNEGGTQDRTAETTNARKQAVGVRPEHMQKKVVEWQSRVASVEALIAWMFVKSKDVAPLMGRTGASLWAQYIENADHELIMRQMRYEVAAASIRRPNKDRDIDNFSEFGTRFLPMVQKYGELSGDYEPANGYMRKFAELHDMELDGLMFPQKDPNDPNAQLDQQMKQAEVQKLQAEAMKLQGEAQANPMVELQMEAQFKQQELQMEQEAEVQRLQMEMQKLQAELEAKRVELELKIQEKQIDMQFKQQEHQQDLQLQQEKGQVDLAVTKEQGALQIAQGRQQLQLQKAQGGQQLAQGAQKMQLDKAQGQQKIEQSKQATKAKVDSTKQTTQAKVQATKAVAAAKPKPSGSKK